MTLRIISDVHSGAEHSGGATLASRWALRQYILTEFEKLMPEDCDLMILGDLFDSHEVSLYDFWGVYQILTNWLDKGHTLYNVIGNHDRSKTSNVMSSFDLLSELLNSDKGQFNSLGQENGSVIIITEPTMTPYGYVIPHLANQSLFDAALAKVPECETLYLHCNYANPFAATSDQSLNLSKLQAQNCKAEKIIIAHEHCKKSDGKVLLPGNQIPTSVSDWLGCDAKYYYQDGLVTVRQKVTDYIEMPWDVLVPTDHKFVRVVGNATADQASQVVTKIAKFRGVSNAFVVSNAVNIESMAGLGDFNTTLESMQAFDCWAALQEVLAPEEVILLKGLE